MAQAVKKTKHSFKYWQWRVIICSMIGYAMFYFVRKNFSFAIPLMQEEYGIGLEQFGLIMSIGGIIYGVSKLINGIIGDRTNARWHLVLGLAVCVAVNFIFGFSDKLSMLITGKDEDFIGGIVTIMAVLYIINQIFQGCGFAPCNHLMVSWVPPHELATKMSIWNTSHSVGAFVAAVLCGYLTSWQLCFWVPACISLVGVFFIIATLRNTPKSVGLPELPKVEGEFEEKEDSEESKAEFRKYLVRHVFMNPIVWILAITDLFVYVVRFAILDWGPTMLKDMGLSQELSGWTVAIFEVAGCLGMLAAGVISDKFFKSRSQRVCAIEMVLVALCLVALYFIQDMNAPVLFLAMLALAGFFLYGPQALLGVVASNEVSKKAASSAVGIIGFMSYISTLITGYPLAMLAKHFGSWHFIFIFMAGVAVVGCVIIATLWNLKPKAISADAE